MLNKNSNKCAFALYTEGIGYAIAIILAGLIMFLTTTKAIGFNSDMKQLTPEINYKFPSVYVNSFLYMKIDDLDKNKFFKNENKDDIFFVKDLIYLGTYKSIDRAKNYYIKLYKNRIDKKDYDAFKDFSNDDFEIKNLLNIEILNCELNLKNQDKINSIYYIKSKNNKNIYITFKKINNLNSLC